jgi:hypothetical protein
MSPHFIAALSKGAIPFLCGLYGTLLAYRILGKKPGQDVRRDQWQQRYGGALKYLGPLLMAFGVFLFLNHGATPSSPPQDWRRYVLADGSCSAEFPGTPQAETQPPSGELPNGLDEPRDDGALFYFIRHSELPAAVPVGDEEQALDRVQNAMTVAGKWKVKNRDVPRDQRIRPDGTPGRELECIKDKGFTVRMRLFVKGKFLYQIAATTADARKDEDEPRRFLESFRFEEPKKETAA